jgi:hypothetical protein
MGPDLVIKRAQHKIINQSINQSETAATEQSLILIIFFHHNELLLLGGNITPIRLACLVTRKGMG